MSQDARCKGEPRVTGCGNYYLGNRWMKKASDDVILSAAKDLLYLFSIGNSRGFAELTLSEKSRFFVKFTLSRARFFAALRMTANGLRMTSKGLGMTDPFFHHPAKNCLMPAVPALRPMAKLLLFSPARGVIFPHDYAPC
jgi:hypothetical protein